MKKVKVVKKEKDFSRYPLLIKKSPPDSRDWKLSRVLPKVEILPRKTNNRETAAPFRDQGPYPTCAAFTAALVKYWQERKDIGLSELLSPWFVYANREDPNEDGMYMRDLMKILKSEGICLERLAPYSSMGPLSGEAFTEALNHRIENYAHVDSIEILKTALFLNGPQFMAVPVYNYTERMWYQRSGDVLLGGHAMEILDYDDDERVFWYQNHWKGFGDSNGRAKMSYDDYDLIWEFWSSVDAKSIPDPHPYPEPSWLDRNWGYLVAGAMVIGIILFIIFA